MSNLLLSFYPASSNWLSHACPLLAYLREPLPTLSGYCRAFYCYPDSPVPGYTALMHHSVAGMCVSTAVCLQGLIPLSFHRASCRRQCSAIISGMSGRGGRGREKGRRKRKKTERKNGKGKQENQKCAAEITVNIASSHPRGWKVQWMTWSSYFHINDKEETGDLSPSYPWDF